MGSARDEPANVVPAKAETEITLGAMARAALAKIVEDGKGEK